MVKRSVLSGEEWDPSHGHHHCSDSGGGMSEQTWVEPNCCCHIWSVDKNVFIYDDIVLDEQLMNIYLEQNMKKSQSCRVQKYCFQVLLITQISIKGIFPVSLKQDSEKVKTAVCSNVFDFNCFFLMS